MTQSCAESAGSTPAGHSPAPDTVAATAPAGRDRTAPPAVPPRQRLIGYGLMIGTGILFCLLDTVAKLASRDASVAQVVWMRYAVHLVLAVVILNPLISPTSWRVNRYWMQLLRALTLVINTALNFLALQYLQLAETLTIQFLAPFMIALISVVALGERIGPRRWAAIGLGFFGILVVTRPGLGDVHPAVLLSIVAVILFAVYAVLTRVLTRTESPGSMLLVSAGVPALLLLPILPFVWVWPEHPLTWGLMIAAGVFGGLSHTLLIAAHRLVSAAELAPIVYVQIIWTVLLGFSVFGDVPSGWTVVGALIVIASGLYYMSRDRVRNAKAPVAAIAPAVPLRDSERP